MTKEISELSQHIVLYSKGWYKKSNDHIKDLKILLSKFCLLDIIRVSNQDIYNVVSDAFIEVCSQKEYRELLRRIFYSPYLGKKHKPSRFNTLNEMLNLMSIIKIHSDNKVLIKLCEPDYKLLPQPEKPI